MPAWRAAISARSLLLGKPVLEATLERLPVSLSIAVYSLVLTLLLGISCGVIAALQPQHLDRPGGDGVRADRRVAAELLARPDADRPVLGAAGLAADRRLCALADGFVGWFRTTTMPAVSLALLQIGLLARITRSTMLEVLRQDYIRTARAKGLPRRSSSSASTRFRNAMIPVVTVIGIIFSLLISGSVVIETVFSLPASARCWARRSSAATIR